MIKNIENKKDVIIKRIMKLESETIEYAKFACRGINISRLSIKDYMKLINPPEIIAKYKLIDELKESIK